MDVLIVGDTRRTPELRHEVPLATLDSFMYAEANGLRVVAISAMEADRVESLGLDVELRPFEDFGADELKQRGLDANTVENELTRRIARELGIAQAAVPRKFPVEIADVLRADGVELSVDQTLFDDRRRVKSSHEIAGIRRAQAATEAAMSAACDLLRRSETQDGARVVDGQELTCELLKERIQQELLAHGALADEIVASHGPQTAVPHESGSGPVASDDIVLIDIFPVDLESACYADMTRTFAVGHASDEVREWHELCRQALEVAAGSTRPGVDGGELHHQVCAFFEENGHRTSISKRDGEVLRDGFIHALGHGVGLEAHELPKIGRVGNEFVAGDVIAVEPGLYRHGSGGIRLEDLLLVTETGCELLTRFPYELELV
jgi:Xaa-Pro aminopeptidase